MFNQAKGDSNIFELSVSEETRPSKENFLTRIQFNHGQLQLFQFGKSPITLNKEQLKNVKFEIILGTVWGLTLKTRSKEVYRFKSQPEFHTEPPISYLLRLEKIFHELFSLQVKNNLPFYKIIKKKWIRRW